MESEPFRPLEVLDRRLDEQLAAGQLDKPTDFDGAAVLEDFLASGDASAVAEVARIPLIQSQDENWKILSGSLVRFVGMVQDMFEPEYFPAVVRLVHKATGETRVISGKFRDANESPYPGYDVHSEVEHSLCSCLLYTSPSPRDRG